MDSSLTSGKTLNGYPYFSTAGNETSGTLTDDKTINVYFVKTSAASPVDPSVPSNPAVPSSPSNSTGTTTISAPAAPTAPADSTSIDTNVEIPDDKTPLANAPSVVSVPGRKGNGTVPKSGTQLISDGKAPLASVPKTGDGLPAVLLTAAASLSGIAALLFTGRRKRNV